LISINSAGFYSYFRIHLPGSFPIVDTHPDSEATTDLRLLSPWPELVTFAREMTTNIDELDAHTHGHIPYVVLLLHYLDKWKMDHEGKSPQTYAEKTAFRKMIAGAARTNTPEGGEENYDEAVAAVLKTITAPALSSSVKEVFEYVPDEVSFSGPEVAYSI
jgi:NEDD8-activating enzyme E1 regulatory subunit